jgi:hypothetical protein
VFSNSADERVVVNLPVDDRSISELDAVDRMDMTPKPSMTAAHNQLHHRSAGGRLTGLTFKAPID